MRTTAFAIGLAITAGAPTLHAIDYKPRLEAEGRAFFEAPGAPVIGSVAGTLETFQEWSDGRQRLVGEFFGRYDEQDDARSRGDVRELYWQLTGDDFELRAGARRVFWGVTESRHLVDVINQSDLVENISGEIKLGQPMVDLALIRDMGTFQLFLMPYQRARTFPGDEGYPRLPLPVHAHEAQYASSRAQRHLDGALRYVNSFGPFDVGIAAFDGTAREPRLEPCLRRNADGEFVQGSPDGPTCDLFAGLDLPQGNDLTPVLQALGLAPENEEVAQQAEQEVRQNLVLVPFYDRLRQLSVDAQFVAGSLAVKLEALRRELNGDETHGAVTGFEYTFGDVAGSGIDVGVLGEHLWDERTEFLGVLADDELFVGSRLSFNDVAGTQVLGGVIASREDFSNRLYGLEVSRRLGDDWKISGEARLFSRMPRDSVAAFLADQDFVTLTIERFF